MRRVAIAGVLAQVDGGHESERQRNHGRAGRDEQRSREQRQHAEVLVLREQRRPAPPEQELEHAHVREERRGLVDEDGDDADRRQDRYGAEQEQHRADDAFVPVPARQPRVQHRPVGSTLGSGDAAGRYVMKRHPARAG
jgi:hypothetical protein